MVDAWKKSHPGIEVTIRTVKTKNGFNTRIWIESEEAISYRETTSMKLIDDWKLEEVLDEMYEELEKGL